MPQLETSRCVFCCCSCCKLYVCSFKFLFATTNVNFALTTLLSSGKTNKKKTNKKTGGSSAVKKSTLRQKKRATCFCGCWHFCGRKKSDLWRQSLKSAQVKTPNIRCCKNGQQLCHCEVVLTATNVRTAGKLVVKCRHALVVKSRSGQGGLHFVTSLCPSLRLLTSPTVLAV